jgi:hypothetical protein
MRSGLCERHGGTFGSARTETTALLLVPKKFQRRFVVPQGWKPIILCSRLTSRHGCQLNERLAKARREYDERISVARGRRGDSLGELHRRRPLTLTIRRL